MACFCLEGACCVVEFVIEAGVSCPLCRLWICMYSGLRIKIVSASRGKHGVHVIL